MSEQERAVVAGDAGASATARESDGSAEIFASRGHRGAAFLVEALILLLFLVTSLCLFMQAFAHARAIGTQAAQLERAVALASNMAERFCSAPSAELAPAVEDGLTATCSIEGPSQDGTDLLRATITVTDSDGSVVFELATARSAEGAGSDGPAAGAAAPAPVESTEVS